MPRLTNAQRQARWRARQAGKLEPIPECAACGRPARTAAKHQGLCLDCWRACTPEGVADTARRVAEWRAKQKEGAEAPS